MNDGSSVCRENINILYHNVHSFIYGLLPKKETLPVMTEHFAKSVYFRVHYLVNVPKQKNSVIQCNEDET